MLKGVGVYYPCNFYCCFLQERSDLMNPHQNGWEDLMRLFVTLCESRVFQELLSVSVCMVTQSTGKVHVQLQSLRCMDTPAGADNLFRRNHLPFRRGLLLKEKNLLHIFALSFPLWEAPIFEGILFYTEANRKSLELFPFLKMAAKAWGAPKHLKWVASCWKKTGCFCGLSSFKHTFCTMSGRKKNKSEPRAADPC